MADERADPPSSDSGDYAEQIAIGVSQNNEVGIVGVLPVDPLSAQGDRTLDLGLLIGLIVSPEVEVRPIFIIEGPHQTSGLLPRRGRSEISSNVSPASSKHVLAVS